MRHGVAASSPAGWGFKQTTGTVAGSDPWPFIPVTSAATPPTFPPLGTAFAPNVSPRDAVEGFFFTRVGTDKTTGGTRRNVVVLGGGVVGNPGSGNLFFRIADVCFDIEVPEPAMGLGLAAGATALVALARRRRS
ncbi:MAG: PEP-CTERM sorting domain-containing protein [Deltaproteobacteria bacterium]|nr:PEP-CTERM sorting domain-containing protein [Deltaproteobacteria bacterium]MBW2497412.1 PEP-CTERM sorting domain-containing protein [Deltaproteobacteria bacterium]